MTSPTDLLPISAIAEPADADDLASAVRESHAANRAVYPIGGGTSLDFGWPPKKAGSGLSLARLNQVLDYPARDLTITVQSGIAMGELARRLAAERQRLPVDVPLAERATLGGVLATNFNGPRRYGLGSIRDFVIGISGVDGRGMAFKGGGRVVKNVAGYDFCKLLTGSLGTLGVVTQLTMRLQPLPELSACVVTAPNDLATTEQLLAGLVQSRTAPVAIQLLAGKRWRDDPALATLKQDTGSLPLFLAVTLEGTEPEVRWMTEQLGREWWERGVAQHETLFAADADRLMGRCVEFPAAEPAPLVVKASVVPSRVTAFMDSALRLDPDCTVLSHAGSGIVFLRLAQPPAGGIAKGLIGTLQSAASAAHGTLVVLSAASPADATHQSVWGPTSSPQWLMTAVKQEFDPRNILNPDRFVYAGY